MLRRVIFTAIVSLISLCASAQSATSTPPKLVVNIVVGAMRAGDIERYRSSLEQGGFLRFSDGGVNFTNANYNFHQTTTLPSLATLSTGALPSSHGVVSDRWWEYIMGDRVDLVVDKDATNLDYHLRNGGYSAYNLISPTLTEALLVQSPQSKSLSIALSPEAAIVVNGTKGATYWVDPLTCEWGSSTAFMSRLPEWCVSYNKSTAIGLIAGDRWVSLLPGKLYVNSFSTTLKSKSLLRKYESSRVPSGKSRAEQNKIKYEQLAYTPAGNRAIFDYAKLAIEKMELGVDSHPDIVNIYLDPARNIAQRYGAESVETEDMLRRLDREIADFVTHLTRNMPLGEIVFVVTSDHGISPLSHDGEPNGRFNSSQFVVLVNSFLRARYGDDNWVLGYADRNLYINHDLAFQHKLAISEVQNEIASFALQFRGVAHALTASAMRNGYFGGGYGHKMQNSFYPRRSGDVVLNFMPGWIEERTEVRADSGSIYSYDSHVPLIIYGEGYFVRRTVGREVVMESVAPTIARILQIGAPVTSEGEALAEIVDVLR